MAATTTVAIVRQVNTHQGYGYPEFRLSNVWEMSFNLRPCRHRRE
jgi:hypothetical protein